jgi:hypothetical protein
MLLSPERQVLQVMLQRFSFQAGAALQVSYNVVELVMCVIEAKTLPANSSSMDTFTGIKQVINTI